MNEDIRRSVGKLVDTQPLVREIMKASFVICSFTPATLYSHSMHWHEPFRTIFAFPLPRQTSLMACRSRLFFQSNSSSNLPDVLCLILGRSLMIGRRKNS